MKILKQFKKASFLILLLLTFVSATSFAQVYVDATNGNDVTGSGTAVAPYASIAKGLSAMDKSGGTLVLKAGTYTGAGLASTNDDIIIRKSQVIDGKTQPAWDDNAVITIRLEQLNGNDVILVSDTDPGQAFTFDVKGGTLNIVSASGTEYMNLTGTVTMNLGTIATRSSYLNIGTLNGGGGNITATAGATLNINDVSAFTGEAPKTSNPVISYLGTGSQSAGKEAQYGAFGTGTITVNKTNNTDVVTFPATAITGVGAINIAKGGATFQAAVTVNADVTVGNGGAVNFTNLNMKNFDFNHGGTGAVAISGTLNFNVIDGAAATDLGQLNVTGGGNFTVNGATEWTEAVTADRDFLANYAINLANGNVTLNGVTLTNNNKTGTNASADYTFTFYNNDNDGTLDVGTVSTNAQGTAGDGYGILNVTNNNAGTTTVNGAIRSNAVNLSTGTLNVSGTIGDALTNAVANGKVNITGATSVAGILTNAGNSTGANTGYMALSVNTLTLTGSVAHLTNGGQITASVGGLDVKDAAGANSFNGGTLSNVLISDGATTTFAGAAVNVTNLTVSDGVLAIGVATTASGATLVDGGTVNIGNFALTTNDFTQSSGVVTLAANAASDLDVNGNFNRTAGTFTAGLASELLLSGTAAQNMNGGPSFQLSDMTVSNTGGLVTIANTVRAIGTITVSAAATVELGNFNLVFNAATGKMVNNGTIQTTGNSNGAVIFGGANFVSAGNNVDGMVLNASSSALFSNIIIDVGALPNDVITTGSAGNIRWTKELYLYTGDLNNTAAVDFAPSGTGASIKRDISTAAGSVNGITLAGGTFNAAAVDYNLTYVGTLTANKTINTTTAVEWDADNVVDLTQSAAGGSFNVQLAGNVVRSIKGNLVITGNATAASAARLFGDTGNLTVAGNINVGQNSVLSLAAADLTLSGGLTVSSSATIIGGNAANVISLAGNGQTHSILGAITAANILTVNGTGVIINGQAASATANQSEIANLTVGAAKSATVSQIHAINGAVTTGATSTLSLGLTQISTASPVDNADGNGTVVGLITLGGTSFTLTSAVEAQAGVTHNLGTVDFGANNLTLTTAGIFNRAAAVSAVYASTGGALVSDFAATYTMNNASIPYWDIKKAIALGAATDDVTVTKELDIKTGGSITNNGADVTIETLMTTIGGNVFIGAGQLILAGTEVVASGNPTISNLTINSTGTATLSSSDEDSAPTWRNYTITGQLKQTAGNVAIKGNNILLTGAGAAFDRTTGDWSATSGVLSFAGTADQTFDPGAGWSVPNLVINNTTASGTEVITDDNEIFTVTGILSLTNGVLSTKNGATAKDGLLALGNGAIVKRDAFNSSLANVPTFGASVDVWYVTTAGGTAKEMPTANTVLNDLQIQVNTVANANLTVNGTLYLMGGALSELAAKDVTIADGATINRSGGTITTAPQATSYNLIYSNTANIVSGNELIGSKVANMTIIPTGGSNVSLGTAVTMSGNLVLNGATTATQLNLAGFNLTTAGNVTITSGDIANSGATAKFTFNGAAKQTLTVPAGGLIFPSTVGVAAGAVEFVLNNTSTDGVHLAGGNLSMQNVTPATNLNIVRFINGNLTTTNAFILTLWQAATVTNQPDQGFDRTGVDIANNKYSHVVGNVRKYVNNSTGTSIDRTEVTFPVGTAAASPGNYRPASFFFKTAPQSALNLTVNHDEQSPEGSNGFPITSGDKKITNYPDFFWYVKSDQALAPSYEYDVEFQAEGYADYITDGIEDLRIIRRDSGNVANNWILQGLDGNYDNSTINATWPVGKVINAKGGITTQGSRFTYSQLNKAPYFKSTLANVANPTIPGAKIGGPVAATEGVALTGTYVSEDPDLNQTSTMFLVSKPDSAVFNATTGAFSWTPDNTTAPGPHYVSIGSTDGTDTTIVTDTINVTDVNQLPSIVGPGGAVNVSEGLEYGFTYTATDKDADNTSFTYSILSLTGTAPDSISLNAATGALVVIPKYGQQGDVFNLTVRVTDSKGGTDDTLSVFTVVDLNRAPTFTTVMPDTSVSENVSLAFTYVATDLDADALKYSLSADAPAGATIDSLTGLFAWTPTYTQAGVYTFSAIVKDNGTPMLVDSSKVTVTVTNANAAPTWAVGGELPDTTIFVGDTLNFTYLANDLDGDAITYSWNGPADARANLSADGILVWDPQTENDFISLVKVKATDGIATITTQAEVTVQVVTVTVSGVVTYNGNALLPLSGVTVTLTDGTTPVTMVTAANGAYSFADIKSGSYSLTATKTTQWGGALASDALETQLYVVNPAGGFLATDLLKLAADVTGVGTITSSDALSILNRSVGINTFQVADWLLESKAIVVGTKNVSQNLMGIAAGDARGDYNPNASLAKVSSIAVNSEEVLNIKKESEFSLPISISELSEVGSYTMKLKYASDKVEFLGASTSNGGMFVSNAVDGVISIAWMNTDSKEVKVNEGAALATLKFKATEQFSKTDEVSLELLDGAELTNGLAKNISANINIPVVAIGIPDVFALRQNYPNPFNPSTTIQYDLPEDGKVTLTIYNSLGQTVGTLVNTKQVAGAYDVKFNASNLSSGVYLYRVTVEGTKNFVMTKKMILMK
ncbi:MAG: T9SS type A sorting domain-containing protein [Bacteroidetes bacterium]|nr:T9SS type A sorting domain-containing protein [Bacteroidota bacterium]MBU1115113.1 T9SS type A sorting domain-containing protein [Bacteroidota bacterium]MBU1798199.1 T9SS type A sorting domain-containing protein [Bacteroidota bacterium]